MTDLTGRLASVATLPLVGFLASDAPIGTTVLDLDEASEFDATGGTARLSGGDPEADTVEELVTYTTADDDDATLTLAAPTTVAFFAGDRVELWDVATTSPVVETVAQVVLPGDAGNVDPVEAVVDHALVPYLPEGLRAPGAEEAVAMEWRGRTLFVTDVVGRVPVMNGAMIDPDTLPPSGGPEPSTPVTPGAPTVIGGFGSLMLRWPGIVHPNPVVYEVHVSAATPVVPSAATLAGELSGTAMTVRSFGTPATTVAYGTTYHVALIAKDSVDETFASALGPEASGVPVQVPGDAIDDAVTDAIAEAQSDATAAQTTADGKNKITYGTVAPTTATPGRPGDVFWLRSGSTITGQYLCTAGTGAPTGNTWAAQTLTNATIATLDAAKVTTGTLAAARIAAKSMTLDKLLIASTDNLLINPDFGIGTGAPAGWTATNATVVNVADGPDAVAANVLRVTPLSADVSTTNGAFQLGAAGTTIEHGKSYRFTMRARLVSGTAGSLALRVGLYRAGAANVWPTVTEDIVAAEATAGAWVTLTGTFTMPTTHDKVSVSIHAASASGSVFEVGDVAMRSMADSSLVVDGGITARALAVDSVTTEALAAGSVTGETLAGELLLGSRITTAQTGQRVELAETGFRLYTSADEIRVNLPTDPNEEAYFRGEVQADGLTVTGGASFFSTQNEFAKDSVISLAEQVAAPIAAPAVANFWPWQTLSTAAVAGDLGTFGLDMSLVQSAAWNNSINALHLVQNVPGAGTRIWYYNLNGTIGVGGITHWDLADWDLSSLAVGSDGQFRMLFRFTPTGTWYIQDYSRPAGSQLVEYVPINNFRRPLLSVDGNDIIVTETETADGSTKFRQMSTATNPASVVGSTITATGDAAKTVAPVYVYRGSADFGGQRWVTAYKGTGDFRAYSSSGVYSAAESWSSPSGKVGAFWHPGSAIFYTVGQDARLYRHSNMKWTTSTLDTWHLAQTFYDSVSPTHETTVGAVRTVNPLKRSWLRVTPAQVPYAGGADDPNQWRLYGKTGTAPGAGGSGLILQQAGTYTQTVRDMGALLATSGVAPPAVSNFPNATPARMISGRTMPSDGTKPIFEVRGDGSGRWGPFEFNGDGTEGTGWLTLPLLNGNVGHPDDIPQYMVRAGVLFLRGRGWVAGAAGAPGGIPDGTVAFAQVPYTWTRIMEVGNISQLSSATAGTSRITISTTGAVSIAPATGTGWVRKVLGGSVPLE